MGDKQSKCSVWPLMATALLLLPVLYALSIGPAYWAFLRHYLSYAAYAKWTGPLRAAAVFCGLQEWLRWYALLWR